jgi:hypothetical protein
MNIRAIVFALAVALLGCAALDAQGPRGPVIAPGGGTGGGLAGLGYGLTGSLTEPEVDPTEIQTRENSIANKDRRCVPASGSGTAYVCSLAYALPSGLLATSGTTIVFVPDVDSGASPTLNVDTTGAFPIKAADGTTAATLTAGRAYDLEHRTTGGGMWVMKSAEVVSPTISWWSNIPYHPTGSSGFPGSNMASANQVKLHKVYVPGQISVAKLGLTLSTAASGACVSNIAVYTTAGALVTQGSSAVTCASGTTVPTEYNVDANPQVTIGPGEYYFAWAATSSSAAFSGVASQAGYQSRVNSGLSAPVYAVDSNVSGFTGTTMPTTVTPSAATIGVVMVTVH